MKESSEWAVMNCTSCNQIFSVPSDMICEDGENYRNLTCPYCGKEGNIDMEMQFLKHQIMNCEVEKITKWIIK